MKEFGHWITGETEINNLVLKALIEDNLVLFVGAGISKASPSSLPLFDELVRDVCKITDNTEYLTPTEKSVKKNAINLIGLDGILGRISDRMGGTGNTLNDEIEKILSVAFAEGRVNPFHQAIIELAKASPTFRVVTTNQDRLLEWKGFGLADSISVYNAPALPEGTDFKGIVNLHGSISDPEKMIFTDRDFGKAYITKQYCSRFLTELFAKFTVLFIGYSHDDPLMKYHARGLGASKRYILTDDPNNSKWEVLGIKTVGYKKTSSQNKHGEVPNILNAMTNYVTMSPSAKRNKIKSIVEKGPQPYTNPEKSFIRDVFLDDSDRVIEKIEFFFSNINDYQWLSFLYNDEVLSENNVIQSIFQNGEYDARTRVVAHWFLRICFCTENIQANNYGYEVLSKHTWKLNDHFIRQVLSVIIDDNTPDAVAANLGLLCSRFIHEYNDVFDLGYYLTKINYPKNRGLVHSILEY